MQRQWLAYLRDRNSAVTLYLHSGIALHGLIVRFDDYTLLLNAAGGRPSLVYKHAISTVLPLNSAESLAPADPQS